MHIVIPPGRKFLRPAHHHHDMSTIYLAGFVGLGIGAIFGLFTHAILAGPKLQKEKLESYFEGLKHGREGK